jgi:hypothetical protein
MCIANAGQGWRRERSATYVACLSTTERLLKVLLFKDFQWSQEVRLGVGCSGVARSVPYRDVRVCVKVSNCVGQADRPGVGGFQCSPWGGYVGQHLLLFCPGLGRVAFTVRQAGTSALIACRLF